MKPDIHPEYHPAVFVDDDNEVISRSTMTSDETREIDGRLHVLETPLTADFAFVRAKQGDRFGNLRFYRSSRNFHPMMAMAGRTTIAEVEELLPVGALDPDDIHLPGVFVQRVIQGGPYENPIEYRTTR